MRVARRSAGSLHEGPILSIPVKEQVDPTVQVRLGGLGEQWAEPVRRPLLSVSRRVDREGGDSRVLVFLAAVKWEGRRVAWL